MNKEIPFISDKLMEEVEKIFAHGPRRAKSHDQRFGQWIVNKIRSAKDFPQFDAKDYQEMGLNKVVNMQKALVEMRLWNMENDKFYDMVKDYND